MKEKRKADRDEDLTKAEMKVYRKMTGKLAWLANSTCPDLSYIALAMSKKNNSAKIIFERLSLKDKRYERYLKDSEGSKRENLKN